MAAAGRGSSAATSVTACWKLSHITTVLSFLVARSSWTCTSDNSAMRCGSTFTSAAPARRPAAGDTAAATDAARSVRREIGGRVIGMGGLQFVNTYGANEVE